MAGDDLEPGDDRDRPPADEPGGRSLDSTVELLSVARRRYAVYALLAAPDGVLAFEELTASVVERVVGDVADPRDHRRRVGVDLRRWHVPALAGTGVVAFDDRSDVVRYGGDPTLARWAERAWNEEFGKPRVRVPGRGRAG